MSLLSWQLFLVGMYVCVARAPTYTRTVEMDNELARCVEGICRVYCESIWETEMQCALCAIN